MLPALRVSLDLISSFLQHAVNWKLSLQFPCIAFIEIALTWFTCCSSSTTAKVSQTYRHCLQVYRYRRGKYGTLLCRASRCPQPCLDRQARNPRWPNSYCMNKSKITRFPLRILFIAICYDLLIPNRFSNKSLLHATFAMSCSTKVMNAASPLMSYAYLFMSACT